jgi:SAM-dependent methyltransferase
MLKSKKPDFLGFYFFNFEKAVAFSIGKEEILITNLKDPLEGREMYHPPDEKFWNFLEHLRRIYRNDEIYVIVNNYDPSRHDKILEWASEQRRLLKLYFTPPHFSWHLQLNEVINRYNLMRTIYEHLPFRYGFEKWGPFEEELLERLRDKLKKDDQFHAEPYEWMCPGRELLPSS